VGGVKLPLALAELGLIDEYEFVVQPRLAGHGPNAGWKKTWRHSALPSTTVLFLSTVIFLA